MLEYKKIISKYESIIKILSFNKQSIHRIVWNYRNLFKYIFFYLFKKTYFIKFLFFYEWLKTCMSQLNDTFNNITFSYSSTLYIMYINNTTKYSVYFLSHLFFSYNYNELIFFNNISNIPIFKLLNINFFFHRFLNLYMNYNYAIYLWLYGIKLTRITFLNCSSLPTKKSIMVVLRSPHKDKKSREKFKITKLTMNLRIPTFLYEKHFLYPFSNDSCLIKCLINLKKMN